MRMQAKFALVNAIAFLVVVGAATATHEPGWIDDYFRVHHKAHIKLNFSCQNRSLCAKPSEDPKFLATVLWPQPAREYVDCMDLLCACGLYKGTVESGVCRLPSGAPLTKAVRKDFRQFSADERAAYFAAMNSMKADGTYNKIGEIHRAAGVHSGPSFFPWHREFLKRVEFVLRQYNPTVALPIWDSTLDSHLPTPADSIFFTRHLVGEANANGDVYDTQFVNFLTMDGRPTFNRHFGAQPDGEMISESRIDWILNQTDITRVLAYSMPLKGCENYTMDDRFLEYSHDYVHYYLNGDMQDRTTSSNDVIFLLHHAMIDGIWELWRQKQQTREQRENDYPPDEIECEPPWHFKNAHIPLLGAWRNVDGLSNKYTDELSVYALRATCTTSSEECESEFLWCDLKTTPERPHCVSKIKPGGNCAGFEWSDEACYGGESCASGRCTGGLQRANMPQMTPLHWRWTSMSQSRPSPPDELAIKEQPKGGRPSKASMRFEVLDVAELTPKKITRFM